MTDKENDYQVGGNHYQQVVNSPQHWDLMVTLKANYFQGVITKYIVRYKHKNGIEDLEKALHYTKKYQQNIYPPFLSKHHINRTLMNLYEDLGGVDSRQSVIIKAVMTNNINIAVSMIQHLIRVENEKQDQKIK